MKIQSKEEFLKENTLEEYEDYKFMLLQVISENLWEQEKKANHVLITLVLNLLLSLASMILWMSI